ncbi:histidine kinase [Polaribacter sp. SA4-10]|uniref:histidine kinase n=1 Tax=Polaribacter sp. SA4-10 TaxID=754397 RepID=UPI000B3C5787|nr:histidine kinase [Polaribacter sp. SA4-10]ARV05458.1 histidine kinase [Polaribacter sp. SA4-10]
MEQPNLEYVDQLARGDESIRKTLIDVIKTEFPEERSDYNKSVKNKEFKKIEGNVHRLKHKISILGLQKSYKRANEFEHNLRKHSLEGIQDFEKILLVISAFLKTI